MTEINTATDVISFARKLEEDGATYYERASRRFPEDKGTLASFASQNRAFITQFETAYYGAITDALEGGFAFNLDPREYEVTTDVANGISYIDVLREAIEMEDRVIKFFVDAARQSGSLLADVRRAFLSIAQKKTERKHILKSLLPGG